MLHFHFFGGGMTDSQLNESDKSIHDSASYNNATKKTLQNASKSRMAETDKRHEGWLGKESHDQYSVRISASRFTPLPQNDTPTVCRSCYIQI
jgi:hypothetical protein